MRDVVFAGEGRSEIGALLFRTEHFDRGKAARLLRSFESTGSSNRVARALVLEEPPSLDAGEMTDKGTVNQRAVLERRPMAVAELYAAPPSARVLLSR